MLLNKFVKIFFHNIYVQKFTKTALDLDTFPAMEAFLMIFRLLPI